MELNAPPLLSSFLVASGKIEHLGFWLFGLLFFFFNCVYVCLQVSWFMYAGQRATHRSQFSLSTTWVPGNKLRFSGKRLYPLADFKLTVPLP